MASEQAIRKATIAPAALANLTTRARSQPASRPWHSAPPKASPAPRPFTTSTLSGATRTCPARSAGQHPVRAKLHDRQFGAQVKQRRRDASRVSGPDGDLALVEVADDHSRQRDRLAAPPPGLAGPTSRTSAGSPGRGSSGASGPGWPARQAWQPGSARPSKTFSLCFGFRVQRSSYLRPLCFSPPLISLPPHPPPPPFARPPPPPSSPPPPPPSSTSRLPVLRADAPPPHSPPLLAALSNRLDALHSTPSDTPQPPPPSPPPSPLPSTPLPPPLSRR